MFELTAVVYELLYEKVFGFDKKEMAETVNKVRGKVYNHNGKNAGKSLNTSGNTCTSSGSSSGDEKPSAASSPVKVLTADMNLYVAFCSSHCLNLIAVAWAWELFPPRTLLKVTLLLCTACND